VDGTTGGSTKWYIATHYSQVKGKKPYFQLRSRLIS